MHASRRLGLGGTLVLLGWWWRLKGPQGGELLGMGPLPSINRGDVVVIPLLVAGLAFLASAPRLATWRRILGVVAVVGAVLWVTSELPWSDPLIPGLQFGRHGLHVLDALAVVPFVAGMVLLNPELSPGT